MMTPAGGMSQKEAAFSRGKAMSFAPIMRGSMKLAKPENTGMIHRKSMTEPWLVMNRLYSAPLSRSTPGWLSSVRITMASAPPMRKNVKVVTKYWMPITL